MLKINNDDLYDLYINNDLNMDQIANIYKCTPTTIIYRFNKMKNEVIDKKRGRRRGINNFRIKILPEPLIEIDVPETNGRQSFSKNNIISINEEGGIYLFYSMDNELLYVGKSIHLLNRLLDHLSGHTNTRSFIKNVSNFETIRINNQTNLAIIEIYLINKLKPKYNDQYCYYDL